MCARMSLSLHSNNLSASTSELPILQTIVVTVCGRQQRRLLIRVCKGSVEMAGTSKRQPETKLVPAKPSLEQENVVCLELRCQLWPCRTKAQTTCRSMRPGVSQVRLSPMWKSFMWMMYPRLVLHSLWSVIWRHISEDSSNVYGLGRLLLTSQRTLL